MAQAYHVRAALARRRGVQVRVPARIGVIVRQVTGQLDHAIFQFAPDAEPGAFCRCIHLRLQREVAKPRQTSGLNVRAGSSDRYSSRSRTATTPSMCRTVRTIS